MEEENKIVFILNEKGHNLAIGSYCKAVSTEPDHMGLYTIEGRFDCDIEYPLNLTGVNVRQHLLPGDFMPVNWEI